MIRKVIVFLNKLYKNYTKSRRIKLQNNRILESLPKLYKLYMICPNKIVFNYFVKAAANYLYLLKRLTTQKKHFSFLTSSKLNLLDFITSALN